MIVPPGVILAVPDDAVAEVNTNVPCNGATNGVQVSVCEASASLTCNKDLISVAGAFWQTDKVLLVPITNTGGVFAAMIDTVNADAVPEHVLLAETVALYVPTAAAAGTVNVIGEELRTALVTSTKPAVCAALLYTIE